MLGVEAASQGLAREEKEFLRQIRFVFTEEEWEALNKLPDERKMAYAEKVLEKRSPDCLALHQQHVSQANELFPTPGFRGSDTDAGRFFIVWGEPQEVRKQRIEDTYWDGIREEFIPFEYKRMIWIYTKGTGLKPGEKRIVIFADVHWPGFFELKSDEVLSGEHGGEAR